jgi:hypothetical protein
MGSSSQTKEQRCGIFQVDIQDKKMHQTKVLKNIKQDLWLMVFLKRKVLIMKSHLLL